MLSEKMAAHYGTIWVKEYAREYLLTHGKNYSFENLLDIARGQIREEEAGIRTLQSQQAVGPNQKPLFIDTDMYVMKVWCEFVFDKCQHWILNRIAERSYDLYLLCNIDVPWVEDELREYPDLDSRRKLYHYYKDLLVNQHVPWVEISGDYEERVQKAIAAVDALTG